MFKLPLPKDFNLTDQDLDRLSRIELVAGDNEIGCSWMDNILPKGGGCISELLGDLLFWTLLWPFFILGMIATPIINLIASIKLSRDPKYSNLNLYRTAVSEFNKTKIDYWLSLSGLDFEMHLADLFRKIGYTATVTNASGDNGIDIVLAKGLEQVIVQCKQHAKPVGPATARDLYGALMASSAQRAILASTSGFTNGVHAFTCDKPIELMDVRDIVAIQDKIYAEQVAT